MEDKLYNINVYSQFGEDGIIQYLLSNLNIKFHKESCEVGMLGIKWSNTFNLNKNFEWKSIFIDKNLRRLNNVPKLPNNILINTLVCDNLDEILKNNNFNINFDILSIDTDGMDYDIWDALKLFRPKIVIVEYSTEFSSFEKGSFMSMIELSEKKNYSFFMKSFITNNSPTGNLFFISNEVITDAGFNQCHKKEFYLEKKII